MNSSEQEVLGEEEVLGGYNRLWSKPNILITDTHQRTECYDSKSK